MERNLRSHRLLVKLPFHMKATYELKLIRVYTEHHKKMRGGIMNYIEKMNGDRNLRSYRLLVRLPFHMKATYELKLIRVYTEHHKKMRGGIMNYIEKMNGKEPQKP